MRVKVPRDLAGGSLLKAHQWAKSQTVSSNPGHSSNDYKIQGVDGTPLTLSDLTSRTFDEVLIISGAKNNPPSGYPLEPTYGYPSFKKNRLGNKPTVLLAKDVDPSMVERLAMQNGMFSALNTVTKLLYAEENMESGTDPKIAALLQTYANATMKVKHNPGGRAFFATDINDRFAGVVSPQEAVRSFISSQYGIDPDPGRFSPDGNTATGYMIEKARILDMYNLNDSSILDEFQDNVLTPFLVSSIANAKLLKAMQHQDYIDITNTHLKMPASGETWKKYNLLLPTQAEDYYDGRDYALIAHPLFMRDSIGLAVMSEKLVKHISKIVKEYPRNTSKAKNSRTMKHQRTIIDSFRGAIETDLVFNMAISQADVMRDGTTPEEVLEALNSIFSSTTRDTDLIRFTQNLKPDFLVSYQRDVAGFRPTAPPYWPKPVVLALMDAIRNNIQPIIKKELDLSTAFSPYLSRPPEMLPNQKKILNSYNENIDGRPVDSQIAYMNEKDTNLYDHWKKNSKKFKEVEITKPNLKEAIADIEASLETPPNIVERVDSETIHILSIFMEIEDTCRGKYRYTMTENDRAFALYLLDDVIRRITKKTGASEEPADPDDSEVNNRVMRILEGYRDDTGGSDAKQLANRIGFEAKLDAIVAQARREILAADDDKKADVVRRYRDRLFKLSNKKGLPMWAVEKIRGLRVDESYNFMATDFGLRE